ncbi:DUF1295-domain-containing protein [Gonapodya prolifera JEL478]|uniref:DUF1295-domain-containing protein n=1 Tax=Gonapodya prolifera (strain JEL478) TaxID=1344416 RepID=A0A139ADU4_GONPJ|nr:DUF1295-domain-containing protein [Gonapodya prolifera JEL478]|eukprot:KXS14930.1 DUF1295-domain-containing protein [Gonapodya prolifera JEL478]
MSSAFWSTVSAILHNGITNPIVTRPASILSVLRDVFVRADPIVGSAWMAIASATHAFVMSELTGDHSYIDRLWSVAPAVYGVYHALRANPRLIGALFAGKGVSEAVDSPRGLLAAALIVLWAIRLTYNFARKGGYSTGPHSEDYRWVWLKQKMRENKIPPALFSVFNFSFIAGYQSALIWGFSLPSYVAATEPFSGWNSLDLIATGAFFASLTLETVADNQQWEFYETRRKVREGKISAKEAGEAADDVQRGFLSRGLFAYSRHPNFFAEQCIWWSMYLLSVSASGEKLNWSGTGAFLLTLLFQGTAPFTEYLTSSKYPEYKTYQKRVPRIQMPLPWNAPITAEGKFLSERN